MESVGFFSRASSSFAQTSFYLTRFDGAGNPMRDWFFLIITILQYFVITFTANTLFGASPLYTYFFGFLRLDITLLPWPWFLSIFWILAAFVFTSIAGFFFLLLLLQRDSITQVPILLRVVRCLFRHSHASPLSFFLFPCIVWAVHLGAVACSPLRLPMLSLFAGTLALEWSPAQTALITASWPAGPGGGTTVTLLHVHCAVGAAALVAAIALEHAGMLLAAPNYDVRARPSLHSQSPWLTKAPSTYFACTFPPSLSLSSLSPL